jgi:hypothetical protein
MEMTSEELKKYICDGLKKEYNHSFKIKDDLLWMNGEIIKWNGKEEVKIPVELFIECKPYMGIPPEKELYNLISECVYYKIHGKPKYRK